MKRGAERQISKDDDADDEVEEIPTGLQMAKDSDLAKREIRGLPKRRSPAVAPALPTTSGTTLPAATPKFGGFSGFGATGGATAPFTFASSPLAGSPLKPADAPAISESASSATKTFASFLGPSSTAGAKPVVSSSSSGTSKSDASGDTDEVALKYYTSIRGLNSSFLSAVSKAIESDPFVDIADLLGQYKKHRVSVQQDYDGKSSHVKTQSASGPPSKPSIPAAPSSFLKPATPGPAAMPVPPTSFAGFAAPTSSAASATGFTSASSTTEPSPFKFTSSSAASSDPKSTSAASSSPFSSFTGAASQFKSATPKEAESTPSLKPAFSLGAFATTSTTSSSASPFGGGGAGATTTLLFSNPSKTSIFGSDKAAPEEKDKEKDKPVSSTSGPFAFNMAPGTRLFSDTTSSSGAPNSLFGSATATKSAEDKEKGQGEPHHPPPTSIFGGPFGSPAKPSPFTFGSSTSSTTPASFGFGVAPGSSEGSTPPKAGSVGFSFGSPSRVRSSQTTSATAPGSVFGAASTTFTSASATGAPAAEAAGSTPASTASTPAPAPAHLDVPSSSTTRGGTPATEGSLDEDGQAPPGIHGGEGEGEEDEETTYTVKAKVFKFTTDREGAPTWSEMGVGMLRLKRHKETNTRRVILRSSVTGKIIINFRIYPGLQPKRTTKTVAFTGHITLPGKDTQTAQYRLRVGNEAAAIEMAEAIEREVRLVQADSSPST